MKFLLIGLLIVFFANGVHALDEWDICIDKLNPGVPGGFSVDGNFQLSWNAVIDSPECSGVDYYKIYLDGVLIGVSSELSYSGNNLADGNYVLGVSAVDMAGNEGGRAAREIVFPLEESVVVVDSGVSSSGGGGSGGGSVNISSITENASINQSNTGGEGIESNTSEVPYEGQEFDEGSEEEGYNSGVTGAVIGIGERNYWGLGFILVALAVLLFLIFSKKR